MFINFQNLSGGARIWIYGSGGSFSTEEKASIAAQTNNFLEGWQRHGTDILGSYEIFYNRFFVLATDEKTPASGCSIDASVHFVQKLSAALGVDLLEKLRVDYLSNEEVLSCSIAQFKKRISTGSVSKDTLVFNHLVQTKADLEKNWLIPAKNSWHKQFFYT